MYATSLRSLARTGTRHGVKHGRCFLLSLVPCRGFLSSPDRRSAIATARRPRDKTRPPRDIAVLGGGLTGLSTAYYLTRALPEARITIYEFKGRLGGWIETDKARVKAPDGTEGTVLFEHAARMVKPQVKSSPVPRWDDLVFFDLVAKLNLTDQLMSMKEGEESVAGYIYYPDHLVGIPKIQLKPLADPIGTLGSLARLASTLTEPLFRDAVPAFFRIRRHELIQEQLFRGSKDVSVGEYYSHRLRSRELVDNIMSAMVHGITGGDVWKQSMASGFFADRLVPTGQIPMTDAPVRAADYEMMKQLIRDKDTFDLASQHLDSAGLWFRDGFSVLTDAMADALGKNPNVTIKMREPATSVRYNSELDKVAVTDFRTKRTTDYDKVVSTIYANDLARISGGHLPSLRHASAVTMMLVNIWYPVPQANFPHNGFGYLLPQSLPFSANPECILGVIIDSDREYPLPTTENMDPAPRGADFRQGTKLTVMMGGHYWSDLPSSYLPTKDQARSQALAAVQRHLNLPPELAKQAHTQATLCRNCIPQHLVGHAARMARAHGELQWAFKGRLAVAGQSYQNPGVLSTLRAGRDMAMHIAGEHRPHQPGHHHQQQQQQLGPELADWPVGDTGLERFVRPPQYRNMARWLLPLRFNSGAFMDDAGNIQPKTARSGGAQQEERQQ